MLSPLLLSADLRLGVDLLQAIRESDLVGILCIVLLLFLSFKTGYHIICKRLELSSASSQSEDFIAECLDGNKSLPEIYQLASEFPDSPLAALLREAYVEYEMEMREETVARLPLEQRVQLGKTSVESALERTIAAELRRLETHLVHLATASSVAPFIGLFGTVWGVLGSFQALGREGNAALATLAPGISTALITTVFGLIVAIPAAVMYNRLSSDVTRLSSQMDSFAHELSNVFQKHLLRRSPEL
ncbi:MAG: biopolymer transport protein TolQ [Candidatus Sumerlaeota bacterium]|nr:biopolymer transport protein TolQ [Candidatus Sumerlaeota bacterium]